MGNRTHYGTRYECEGITAKGHRCARAATEHFERTDGIDSTCVGHYCRQHANGAGPTRLLRPLTWEYDVVRSYSR